MTADDYLSERQYLLVHFASRDTDLYTKARKFAQAWVDDPDYKPTGMTISNDDLKIVKKETGWLDAPSIEEVQMKRFYDVGEEL